MHLYWLKQILHQKKKLPKKIIKTKFLMVIICPNLANLKGQNMNGIRGGFNTRPNFFRIFFSATVPNNKL